jgi:hypothetical protein
MSVANSDVDPLAATLIGIILGAVAVGGLWEASDVDVSPRVQTLLQNGLEFDLAAKEEIGVTLSQLANQNFRGRLVVEETAPGVWKLEAVGPQAAAPAPQ